MPCQTQSHECIGGVSTNRTWVTNITQIDQPHQQWLQQHPWRLIPLPLQMHWPGLNHPTIITYNLRLIYSNYHCTTANFFFLFLIFWSVYHQNLCNDIRGSINSGCIVPLLIVNIVLSVMSSLGPEDAPKRKAQLSESFSLSSSVRNGLRFDQDQKYSTLNLPCP